jgi:hypothetical protein
VGDYAYATYTNFLWEEMNNYVRHQKIFTGLCAPQNSMKGPTNIVHIFEQLFSKDIVQEIVNETNHYAQQCRNSRGNIFPKQSRVNVGQSVTAEYIPYWQFSCLWALYKNPV